MVFVFDIDDTLCDTDGYSETYMLKFFKENNLPYKFVSSNVRFAEMKFDWDKDTALDWYKTYGDEMMLNFPCKKDVVSTLNYIHNLGHKIIIATARATDWHTDPESITLNWLKNNNIWYDKIYIGRIDKEKICEDENADVFVDDDTEITQKVLNYFNDSPGKFVFLPNTNYNQSKIISKKIQRINNFKEIIKLLNI